MQAHGGEDGQVQHRDTGALQDQAVGGAPLAQPPADAEQRHRYQRHPGVAVLHRHRHPFRGIAQEEGQADEQQHHADAQYRVAAEQPALGRGEATLDQRGFAWRRWRGGTARRWLGVRLERRLTLDGLDGFGGRGGGGAASTAGSSMSQSSGGATSAGGAGDVSASGWSMPAAGSGTLSGRSCAWRSTRSKRWWMTSVPRSKRSANSLICLRRRSFCCARFCSETACPRARPERPPRRAPTSDSPAKPPRIRPTSMKIHCMRRILDQEVPRSTDTCPGHPARAEPAPGVYSPHSRDSTHSDARPVASYLFLAMNWTTQAAPVWKRPSTTSRSISRASSTSHSGKLSLQRRAAHQHVDVRRAAGAAAELFRPIGLQQEETARSQRTLQQAVESAAHATGQVREDRHHRAERRCRRFVVRQVDHQGVDRHAFRLGQPARLGQADGGAVHAKHLQPQRSEEHRVAPLALGDAQHRPGQPLRMLLQESVGFGSVDILFGGIAFVPHEVHLVCISSRPRCRNASLPLQVDLRSRACGNWT